MVRGRVHDRSLGGAPGAGRQENKCSSTHQQSHVDCWLDDTFWPRFVVLLACPQACKRCQEQLLKLYNVISHPALSSCMGKQQQQAYTAALQAWTPAMTVLHYMRTRAASTDTIADPAGSTVGNDLPGTQDPCSVRQVHCRASRSCAADSAGAEGATSADNGQVQVAQTALEAEDGPQGCSLVACMPHLAAAAAEALGLAAQVSYVCVLAGRRPISD